MVLQGRILKSISGFYEVEAADELYTCKARGVFRKTGTTPLVGDLVQITADSADEGTVDEVFERRNALTRPPVANLANLFEADPDSLNFFAPNSMLFHEGQIYGTNHSHVQVGL